jgi:hypothetical protein
MSQEISLIIWPDNIKLKDINLMVLSGIDVMTVIKTNTYSGLEAKLKFNFWKRNNYDQRKSHSKKEKR